MILGRAPSTRPWKYTKGRLVNRIGESTRQEAKSKFPFFGYFKKE
jgi:hypothetical protein